MSQTEKDTLLEKFLARALSEADKTAFEDLVRTDDIFAGEVALRLAEADSFHRVREAEKTDMRQRWRQRKWLHWITRTAIILLLGVGAYRAIMAITAKETHIDTFEIILKYPPDTFNIVMPFKASASAGKTPQLPPSLCIRDKSRLNSIPKKPVAGQSSIRWEKPFAIEKYEEALSAVNEYLSNIDTMLANDPRACAVGGALNICLQSGDPNKAVKYLEVVQKNKRYWEQEEYKPIKTLLMFAYVCTGDCEKARAIKTEQPLPADLKHWLDACNPKQ